MRIGEHEVRGDVVEAVRRIYVEAPWTTSRGLARRFGLRLEVAQMIIVGGWRGIDGLTTNIVAPNLAVRRIERFDELKIRFDGVARIRVEPDLKDLKTVRGLASMRELKRAKRNSALRRDRARCRRAVVMKKLAACRAGVLVGASQRAARLRTLQRKRTKKEDERA